MNPGLPVLVKKLHIEVTGSGKEHPDLQTQGLAENFPLQEGNQLDDRRYEAGKKAILTLALTSGFLKARFIKNRVAVRQQEKQADIELCLATGPLYFFGKTTSEQNIITPKLFQGYIPYHFGEVYSFEVLSQFQTDLYSTGYFGKVRVEPDLSLDDKEGLHIPVNISLSQLKKKNRYSFGLGYGTDTGARGNIGWTNRIINRWGHKPFLHVQLAEKSSRVAAGYEIPVPILDLRYDILSFDALYFDQIWEDTVSEQLSLSTSLKHNAPKYQFGVGLEYLDENYTAGGMNDSTYLLIPSGFFTMIVAGERVNTKNGLRINASVQGAETSFLSSTSFFQFQAGGKAILTPQAPLEQWRLLGRINFGATAMESLDQLPPSLRFYAGGDHSVRGYAYKALGPKDDSGRVVGGQYLTEASVEIEREIFSIWSVAVFYDIGNAYDDIDADLQQGAGVGVRMTLPFGKIRLDFAEALSEDGFSPRIHLTLGSDL
ncbi:MAG: hypothetical protein D3923_10605 [Candidatus Electrothrix sp. AR3]|nr:hypothetical protein [Candidatus Electrothrix sp. AR3]